jgi:hypothetical protein
LAFYHQTLKQKLFLSILLHRWMEKWTALSKCTLNILNSKPFLTNKAASYLLRSFIIWNHFLSSWISIFSWQQIGWFVKWSFGKFKKIFSFQICRKGISKTLLQFSNFFIVFILVYSVRKTHFIFELPTLKKVLVNMQTVWMLHLYEQISSLTRIPSHQKFVKTKWKIPH